MLQELNPGRLSPHVSHKTKCFSLNIVCKYNELPFIIADKIETIPEPASGVQGTVGHWMSPEILDDAISERFPGCMKGRTMYLVPFSMGPIGGPLSKNGIGKSNCYFKTSSLDVSCMKTK